jgi:hypothetical protein
MDPWTLNKVILTDANRTSAVKTPSCYDEE